jgi:uncharacterized protein
MVIREDTLGGTARRRQTGTQVEERGSGEVKYQYISADNHMDLIWYPRDIIQSRISAKYREKAPKVVETDKGTMWEWEGAVHAFAADGKDWAKYSKRFAPIEIPEGKLPPTDPEVLLKHFDLTGIYAGVFYGNTRKWTFQDKEMEKEVYRAFNDWTMEVSSQAPDRIIALPWLHAAFPETSVDELYRLVDQGARAVEFSCNDAGLPVWHPEWEKLWAAAEETGTIICSHIGDKAGTPYPKNEYGASLAHFSQCPFVPAGTHIAQLVFSGMFDRHPNLQVSFAECRIGWLPFLFSWMDRCHNDRLPDSVTPLKEKPTFYVKRNMTFTFEEDYIGAKQLADPEFGLQECAIWGCDYPHEQGQTWPDATPAMNKMFADVSPQLKHEIVWAHAQRLFSINGPENGAH